MIDARIYRYCVTACILAAALSIFPAFRAGDAVAQNTATEVSSTTVEDGGTGSYKAIQISDSSLPTHTVYRPKDLSAFGTTRKLPIIAWGNGGCANSPRGFVNFLSEVASHGFLVVAIGPSQPSGQQGQGGGMGMGGSTKSSQLIDAVEWAIAQNGNKASVYYNKIDTSKIAVIGQSCGGLQAMEVSTDPRITTTVICNSGILNTSVSPAPAGGAAPAGGMPGMPAVTKDQLAKLHAPILYLLGGSTDIAYANGTDDFKRIEKLPAFMGNMDVGHGGTYSQPHGGEFAKAAVAWFKWQLTGDTEAAKLFTGNPCGLSKVAGWAVEKKNIP